MAIHARLFCIVAVTVVQMAQVQSQTYLHFQHFFVDPSYSLTVAPGASEYYSWDGAAGIYKVNLVETVSATNKFAVSPQFPKVQSGDFFFQVDMKPVSVSFGMGIGLILYDSELGLTTSIDQGKYLSIHHTGSNLPLFSIADGGGHNYQSTAPTLGTWYTVHIHYVHATQTATIYIVNKATNQIFYQQAGVAFNPVAFNTIGLGAVTAAGDGSSAEMHYDNITTDQVVGISAARNEQPTEFSLGQNYPNPFNPQTRLTCWLPMPSNVRFEVVNLLGQAVALLDEGEFEAGYHTVRWTASAPSGVYICRMTATSLHDPSQRVVATRRMVLIK
jgi:hypothetical protein